MRWTARNRILKPTYKFYTVSPNEVNECYTFYNLSGKKVVDNSKILESKTSFYVCKENKKQALSGAPFYGLLGFILARKNQNYRCPQF